MDITLKDLIKLFSKNFVVILICSSVGLISSFMVSKFLIKPTYVSTVKLYVYTKQDNTNPQTYNSLNDLNYAQKIVNTYIEMLRTDSFYKSVKDRSALDYSVDDLKRMIQFSVLNDTEVFEASVSSHKPEDSKLIADTVTNLAPQAIAAIRETALLKVVDSATFPTKASSPNLALNSVVGFLLGLAFSLVYVLLRDILDIRIKQEDDLTSRYNIPILGAIPTFGETGVRTIIFEKEEKHEEVS